MVIPEILTVPNGLVAAAIFAAGRWFLKIERGLAASATTQALTLEKLNGHCAVDDERHKGVDKRLDLLEQARTRQGS